MNIFYRILWKLERNLERGKLNIQKAQFKYCGVDVKIENSCNILGANGFSIGDNSSLSCNTTVFATFGVTIGKNCLISSNCGISSYNHITNSLDRMSDTDLDVNYSKPVIVKDNVWVGMNTCILPGVTIGNNAIIGSGSVVTKNVPENQIWAGNPAKFLKMINFDK